MEASNDNFISEEEALIIKAGEIIGAESPNNCYFGHEVRCTLPHNNKCPIIKTVISQLLKHHTSECS